MGGYKRIRGYEESEFFARLAARVKRTKCQARSLSYTGLDTECVRMRPRGKNYHRGRHEDSEGRTWMNMADILESEDFDGY